MEFDSEQRKVLDRYANFLGSLPSTIRNIPIVFERRRRSGHQLAVLAADSRLKNAEFNERYLRGLWSRSDEIMSLCSAYLGDLETFTRECLDITKQTSKDQPIAEVDFRLFSLASSPTWKLFPAQNVGDLVHELVLRFYEARNSIWGIKTMIEETYVESFGLRSAFTTAMEHRSCKCHQQPAVAEELFRDAVTAPVWDIVYSSRDAAVKAAEYKSDVITLFRKFSVLNSAMQVFLEIICRYIDSMIATLSQTIYLSRMHLLNFNLRMATGDGNQFMAQVNAFEAWLRK